MEKGTRHTLGIQPISFAHIRSFWPDTSVAARRCFYVIFLLCGFTVQAQAPAAASHIPINEQRFNLLFHKNSYVLEPDFASNPAEMRRLAQFLSDPVALRVIDSIRISAFASPEGETGRNGELALNRAWAARLHLLNTYPRLNPDLVHARAIVAEDWPGLFRRIESDTLISDREYLLYRLRSTVDPELRKELLYASDSGRHYEYIKQYILPSLRNTEICVYTDVRLQPFRRQTVPAISPGLVLPSLGDSLFIQCPLPNYPLSHTDSICNTNLFQPRFALKTNLLYLAATVLNIEGELYVGRRWSLNVDYQYAWWSRSSRHHYFRLAAVSPEVRYWFSAKKRFKGHFGGFYLGTGLYEFMFKPTHGIQGEFFIAGGLTYGYMFPLGKRLRMELSLGVGYMMTEYREYHWDRGCYVYEKTKRYSYLGPTKAKVSLVLPLYRFNRRNERPAR